MKSKEWFKITIGCIVFYFSLIAFLIITIDPYFHYRKPLSWLGYEMNSEKQRYINDGIIRNFEYNSVIIGSSMTDNFRSSKFDKIFNVNSIKIPFSGATYKEISDNMELILTKNKNIKYFLRCIDYDRIFDKYDEMSYRSYPTYLYDNNIFNDVNYFFNIKTALDVVKILKNTLLQIKTPTFDEYSRWNEKKISGKNEVLRKYTRPKKINNKELFTEKDKKVIDRNIEENIIRVPKKYPNTKFIYFITPHSIVSWDALNQRGRIEKQILAEKYIIEKILEVPNIELYSFFDNYDIITNLDNYTDPYHYMGNINEEMLDWIKNKKYRLTKKNYKEYIKKNLEFYKNYDYDKIFEKR